MLQRRLDSADSLRSLNVPQELELARLDCCVESGRSLMGLEHPNCRHWVVEDALVVLGMVAVGRWVVVPLTVPQRGDLVRC